MKLEKHRYIVFKFYTENEISQDQFIDVIWSTIQDLYGCKGSSETGMWVVEFDPIKKRGLIRCNLKSLICVKTSLVMITHIDRNVPILIQILGISGTIKMAKNKFY